MYIEKKYNTEKMQRMEAIMQEIETEKAALTEEEQEAERVKNHMEAQSIVEKMMERERNSHRIINQIKAEWFHRFSFRVLQMAEDLMLDVTIQNDGKMGKIKLSFDFLILNGTHPKQLRETMVELVKSADDFWISAKGNVAVIECFYEFVEKIPKG